jgi:hypothetical protein
MSDLHPIYSIGSPNPKIIITAEYIIAMIAKIMSNIIPVIEPPFD